MKKCDCYHEQAERHYFTDYERGFAAARGERLAKYETRTYGVCWGTKESDRCQCGGDKMKCDFYADVRKKAKEELRKEKEKIAISVAPKAFDEIKDLIYGFWGSEPIYYVGKDDSDETRFAKLCCCILEVIANVEDRSETTVFQDIKTGLKQAIAYERKEYE